MLGCAGFKYNTLSFLYLNVPGISRLRWHPFSTTSSPCHDNNEVSVCIKPLGDWTTSLHKSIAAKSANHSKSSRCPFTVKLQAEGPYGHETNYFLRFVSLYRLGISILNVSNGVTSQICYINGSLSSEFSR